MNGDEHAEEPADPMELIRSSVEDEHHQRVIPERPAEHAFELVEISGRHRTKDMTTHVTKSDRRRGGDARTMGHPPLGNVGKCAS